MAWDQKSVQQHRPTINVSVKTISMIKPMIVTGKIMGLEDGKFFRITFDWHELPITIQASIVAVLNCLNENRPITY
jgi:hypothetical protein